MDGLVGALWCFCSRVLLVELCDSRMGILPSFNINFLSAYRVPSSVLGAVKENGKAFKTSSLVSKRLFR